MEGEGGTTAAYRTLSWSIINSRVPNLIYAFYAFFMLSLRLKLKRMSDVGERESDKHD